MHEGLRHFGIPKEGEPTLIAIEPQEEDARRTAWTQDIRLFKSYDDRDPRPPTFRSLDVALQVLKERDLTGRVGLELSQGTQSADRMVGEPTTWTQPWFDAFKTVAREVVDASAAAGPGSRHQDGSGNRAHEAG